jgi:O-6-methylguanine DNA methyltransferase
MYGSSLKVVQPGAMRRPIVTKGFEHRLGIISVSATTDGIVAVDWGDEPGLAGIPWTAGVEGTEDESADPEAHALAAEGVAQVHAYLSGTRKQFDLPLVLRGTPFQQSVWKALLNIPYGETRSYRDIATHISNPKAVRAVGQANRANHIPIIIPCHRVIGASGALTGYAGSQVHMKAALLDLEDTQGDLHRKWSSGV